MLLHGTEIAVQELRPLIPAHAHLGGVWLKPALLPYIERTTIKEET